MPVRIIILFITMGLTFSAREANTSQITLPVLGFFVISCSSRNIDRMPEDVVIRYAENGTPSHIKGKNLSSHLDDDPQFRMLKKEGLYGEIAYQFLQSLHKSLKIDDPRREFEITEVDIDDLAYKHIKLQQVLNGIAIWGRSVSIHLNQSNQVYFLQGHYEPTVTNVDTTPNLSVQEAAQRAISEAPGGEGAWRAEEKRLFIFMVATQNPRLVYRVTLMRGLTRREYYFVDARDGKILHRLSGTPRGHSLP
jgi:Zn-dependent metalloprotease